MKKIYLPLFLMFLFTCTLNLFAATKPGLHYSYYEGNWSTLPDFNTLSPLETGTSSNIDLGVRNRDTTYAFLWQGYISIPVSGNYTFETSSDDGSRLYIGQYSYSSTPLVNNDGLHGTQSVSQSTYLTAGLHPIAISFFQGFLDGVMNVYWTSSDAGISRQLIPDNAFSYFAPPTVNSTNTGLRYSYYENTTWTAIPDFTSLTPVKTGISPNIDLGVRNRDQNYAILWQGYITIPADGTYTFETNSDDGSKLYLGEYSPSATALVNNDGQHSVVSQSGSIYLTAGVYPFTVSYLQSCCAGSIDVYWSSSSGIVRQPIPDNAFSFSSPATVNQISTGLDYSYYEGTWSYLPDFSTLTPNKTGTSSNVTLGIRNRDQNYSVLWQGYITIPVTGTYNFETNSDDGSKLYLSKYSYGATALVNNDGNHGFQLVSDSIHLNAGVYPITIAYLQSCCAGTLEVYWSSNTGISRQRIPDGAFSHVENGGITSTVNYYFSSSTGNDAYTSVQARNPATPWKTLSKLNSMLDTVSAGSAMLLKRGDVFEGSLVFRSSGASGNPIIISAYDTGRKPVITGLTSVVSWFYRGNGVWRGSLPPNNIARLNMVVQNGRVQAMGRYPNITAANKGYLTFNSHSGSATITDNNHSP
ncbi:MAG: hypothetical protein INR73_28515, partial [Williamsia sp.]|nr:hypothetical protein [Williamsia sp.]